MLLCLVRHENLEEKFKLSEERMASYLFKTTHDWFCLVAQDLRDNLLKGFLTYTPSNINRAFHLSSLIHIDHLYVKPESRRDGVGESLIQELKNRAKNLGANRLELWCLISNEDGNAFYKKLGAEKMDFVNLYRISAG
ncbi:MAG: GNAT family N-acetyltransferase [Proteobacteria bacterium]|nr:GNAT family N-acetyltransferase [Pseudomonadota bacterium]